ncbi:MAG: response regulator transcription factor [Candidatus Roizmanbacteria bacterium]|nr:response regulator transcription factor [Candidatus Roizmanbacteria bacterium]
MRILIVEDEHRIAHSLQKGLEQERFAVDIAYTGREGYDLASTEDYDLIILDLMLPGMDGISICKELRKNKIHIPILLLTAKSQTNEKVEGLNSGADDYLTKPFSFDELLARIRALLRRKGTVVQTNISVDDLTMDVSRFEVKRGGSSISLTSKEFSLLEFLLSKQNQIVTKDQIIQHVWNFDADILPNTVEVYIKKLRDKIDNCFPNKKQLIKTVRGFGYKLGGDE